MWSVLPMVSFHFQTQPLNQAGHHTCAILLVTIEEQIIVLPTTHVNTVLNIYQYLETIATVRTWSDHENISGYKCHLQLHYFYNIISCVNI